MKKQIFISMAIVATIIVAGVWFLVSFRNDREMQPVQNSTPVCDQALVQASRPEPPPLESAPAGPVHQPVTDTVPRKEEIPVAAAQNAADDPTATEWEKTVFQKAMVFRDEALTAFPVYSVQVYQPESVSETAQEPVLTGNPITPRANEIWIRIKPDNAREMREIMAQTADLYREHVDAPSENIVVVNWVGGQAWARMEFDPDGRTVTP